MLTIAGYKDISIISLLHFRNVTYEPAVIISDLHVDSLCYLVHVRALVYGDFRSVDSFLFSEPVCLALGHCSDYSTTGSSTG